MADKAEMLLSTPLGSLLLAADALGLTGVRLVTSPSAARETRSDNPLLREAAGQIAAYFAGRLRRFDLPLHPAGTPLQQRVCGLAAGFPGRRNGQS